MSDAKMVQSGFGIFIDTSCEGCVPLWRGYGGMPYFYSTEEEAEREIAEDLITRLEEFLDSEREFEDAMTVEEYILPVQRLPDGSVVTEDGKVFGRGR
ncbi:MAG TPA: hypothetical protein VGH19_02375 [Verrucomicrobiae bacterium]